LLLAGIALGLIVGLLAGGTIGNLVSVRLRLVALLFGAVIVRFGTEAAIVRGVDAADILRVPLFGLAYGMLLVALWANRRHPGMIVAFVGILLNAVAILVNGGYMPVWAPSLAAAGLGPTDFDSSLYVLLPPPIDASFLLHAGPLGDVIPIPLSIIQNVISVGDVFITLGLAFFLFATVVRSADELDEDEAESVARRLVGLAGSARLTPDKTRPVRGVRPETGLAPGLAQASVLERPAVLGGTGVGLLAPALAPLEAGYGPGHGRCCTPSRGPSRTPGRRRRRTRMSGSP
jgi:hypothetical protein